MPIFERDMSYNDMLKASARRTCSVCGGRLFVAWSAELNCYMLRCKYLAHGSITSYRPLSPEEIEGRKVFMKGEVYMESQALTKLSPEKMLARVNHVRWPRDLTVQDARMLAQVAIEYGLDPLFGELMLYQGKPYVTIGARRRKAQETGNLDGISSRPATHDEKALYGLAVDDYLFFAEVRVKGAAALFGGHGVVTRAEVDKAIHQAGNKGHQTDALPIVKDPMGMAEKRAEALALKRAFSLPLPSAEDILEAEFTVGAPERRPALKKAATVGAEPDVCVGCEYQGKCKDDPQLVDYCPLEAEHRQLMADRDPWPGEEGTK